MMCKEPRLYSKKIKSEVPSIVKDAGTGKEESLPTLSNSSLPTKHMNDNNDIPFTSTGSLKVT